MVVNVCVTSQGQPVSGSRKRAMTARRAARSCFLEDSSGITAAGAAPPQEAKICCKFRWIAKSRESLPHTLDSHKVYYGKYLFGGIAQQRHDHLSAPRPQGTRPVSYTHLRAHETRHDLVCRLLL